MESEIVVCLGINGGFEVCRRSGRPPGKVQLEVLAHRNTRSEAERVAQSFRDRSFWERFHFQGKH